LSSSSDDSTPVKSIFEGASKYDILNYLEDARERGLTDCDLGDLEEEQEEEQDHGEPPEVGGTAGIRDILYRDYPRLGCPSKLDFETTKTGSETSFITIRTKRLLRLFRFYIETEIFDVSLNQNKQKINRNSLIWSIFWYFFRK
jgi:hypothetical protein